MRLMYLELLFTSFAFNSSELARRTLHPVTNSTCPVSPREKYRNSLKFTNQA